MSDKHHKKKESSGKDKKAQDKAASDEEMREEIKNELREELKLEIKDKVITDDLIKEKEKILKKKKMPKKPSKKLIITLIVIVACLLAAAAYLIIAPMIMDAVPEPDETPDDSPNAPLETCEDGILNQDETGIDCGGSCPPCETCSDGVKNQDETDVDCGGSSCGKCNNGRSCSDDSDCVSNTCISNLCKAASCEDGKKNQGETGVDCGGPCTPCVSCSNGIMDGDEEGIDCGGKCPDCTSFDVYPEDLEWLSENFKKGSSSLLRRNAVPNGLRVGEGYVFAVAISNIYQQARNMRVVVDFSHARDYKNNPINLDEEEIVDWLHYDEIVEEDVEQYDVRYVAIPVKVEDTIGDMKTISGYYTFDVTVQEGNYANRYDDVSSYEINVRVLEE
jgi:hypothetical protein